VPISLFFIFKNPSFERILFTMPTLTSPYSKAPAILLIGKTGEKSLRPRSKSKNILKMIYLIGSGKSTLSNMLLREGGEEEKFTTSDHSVRDIRYQDYQLIDRY
jgi:hypothetical protein